MDFLSPAEWDALLLSLKVSVWAVVIGLPLAIAAAWLLSRKRFFGKGLFNILIHAPLVVPPVVMGYLLLAGFAPRGPIGGFLESTFGISFAFSWRGAALAAGIMAFPLMVRSIRLSFDLQSRRLEQAAASLGAGALKIFFRLALPQALPGVITGAILGFARALGEFGATITFVSNIPGLTQTLPLALYTATQSPGGEDTAFRLMLISLGLAILALALSEIIVRRAMRAAGERS